MAHATFTSLYGEAEQLPEYWHELAVLDFTEEVVGAMEGLGINRSDLARRLGTSPAYITRIMSGNANFTLMTMTKLAMALESELHVHIAPRGARTWWLDDLSHVWAAGDDCCVRPLDETVVTFAPATVAQVSQPVADVYYTIPVEQGAPHGQPAAAA